MRMFEKNSRRMLSWRVHPCTSMRTRQCLSRCLSARMARLRVQRGPRLLAAPRPGRTSSLPFKRRAVPPTILLPSLSLLPSTSSYNRQPTTDSPTMSLPPSSHPPHVRVSRPRSARDGAPLGLNISTTTATKSPAALASIVKSATPPSLSQLLPPVAASLPALRRTSPTQSRDEDQSMDQSISDSKPALASPPPMFSHTALPTSTASAIAGGPGSSASPKPLHSNSTSSPLLNHAAQFIAAQAPFQLALLLSSALADADTLRHELTVAQSRATRAERLLVSVQDLPSRDSPDPNVDEEKTNGEREREKDVKAESQVPESAVKAVLDAEARAERAHVDLAASLQSLCAVHRGQTVRACVLAPLRRRARASSQRRRTSPWLTPVTRPSHLPRARIFSTNKGTTPSACLPFPCRTPSALRPPKVAYSPG
ncbi:hypothetical protein DFH11DRAFT_259586 [Phellopilus nigrolimitatus]|nr:hypothetical protein DFH11DRAFT_259586 [Phellopilus nigrolimitatus]